MQRIPILDGWRAVSILLVLAGHLLPLGPRAWALNGAFGSGGMAIFFAMSGFLIGQFMIHRPEVRPFLLRRAFRILPLAWLAILVIAVANRADAATVAANLLFFANLPPDHLMHGGEHLWSLCVEVQFYAFVALLVAVFGRRGLWVLPVVCLGVTALRVYEGVGMSIYTWQRVDEILSGACLAMFYARSPRWTASLPPILPLLLLPILFASAHGAAGPLAYLRPYIAAATVGASLYAAPAWMQRAFSSAPARYIGEVSYAAYMFHAMLSATWLGSGDTLVKYAKRPLLFALTFAAAHLSTFYFEIPMIGVGKRIEKRKARVVPAPVG